VRTKPPGVPLDGRQLRSARLGVNGDTSYIAIVDKDRNMVSFEPSLHSIFGTGVVMGNTGIIFNCRGDYYSLVRVRPTRLSPGSAPGARYRAR
jgi:gamma-glutamyltranspeptidase/glutathione hydrolase